MARKHNSYLLRCWDLDSEAERIEIEHIQSGTKTLARSVMDAVTWICAQDDDREQHESASGSEVEEAGGRSGSFGSNRE